MMCMAGRVYVKQPVFLVSFCDSQGGLENPPEKIEMVKLPTLWNEVLQTCRRIQVARKSMFRSIQVILSLQDNYALCVITEIISN